MTDDRAFTVWIDDETPHGRYVKAARPLVDEGWWRVVSGNWWRDEVDQ